MVSTEIADFSNQILAQGYNKKIVQMAGKTTDPYKCISKKNLWFQKKKTNCKTTGSFEIRF